MKSGTILYTCMDNISQADGAILAISTGQEKSGSQDLCTPGNRQRNTLIDSVVWITVRII